MGKPIIVFDLDGTLVDTAPDLLDSLNHTLDAGGVARTDTAGFRQFVGHGGRVMIERAYQAQKKALPTTSMTGCSRCSSSITARTFPASRNPIPAWSRRWTGSATAGYLLAVCTNKTEEFSQAPARRAAHERLLRSDLRPGHVSHSASPTRGT